MPPPGNWRHLRHDLSQRIKAAFPLDALEAHAMLPRYDWRSPAPDGRVVLLYDRWTGRFQRTTFLETGKIQLSDVYVAP